MAQNILDQTGSQPETKKQNISSPQYSETGFFYAKKRPPAIIPKALM